MDKERWFSKATWMCSQLMAGKVRSPTNGWFALLSLFLVLAFATSGCTRNKVSSSRANAAAEAREETEITDESSTLQLKGAGATFVAPFFTAAFFRYRQGHPDVDIDFQPTSRSGGIFQFSSGVTDFGATEIPLNGEELRSAQRGGRRVIHVPVALGAVAVVYNVDGVLEGLKLTPGTLADIYLGKVVRWNDPEVASVNPGLKLPPQNITVVHRSDSSGTSYLFTDYLSRISPSWKSKTGQGASITWPAGLAARGNGGVSDLVVKTPGAIGYVQLSYMRRKKLSAVLLQNAAGSFVPPSVAGALAAAVCYPQVDAKNFSIVNAPGQRSYPICGYAWVLLYRDQKDATTSKGLVDLMLWLVGDAQDTVAAKLDYAPLPGTARQLARREIRRVEEPEPDLQQ